MNVFVARQAVFDRSKKVVAYELLFRAGPEAAQSPRSDLLATTHVLSSGFFDIGFDRLLDGHRALINVPSDLLVSDLLRALPSDRFMLEILEPVVANPAVLNACEELRALGFTLVLDDYTGQTELEPLLRLVDLVKVDFRAIEREKAIELSRKLSRMGKALLAEKVETEDEFEAARSAGYSYFQGFFLERPRVITGRSVPTESVHLLRLLSLVTSEEDVDPLQLEAAISQDLGLSLKLIRYANTARFSGPVGSLRHCLMRLGSIEIRRFLAILAFPQLSGPNHSALVQEAVIRGRMCENLASEIGRDDLRSQAFLAGMFSLLDAIMGVPMREIAKELSLSEELGAALMGEDKGQSTLGRLLAAGSGYQKADLEKLNATASQLGITMPTLADTYIDAIGWASEQNSSPSSPQEQHGPFAKPRSDTASVHNPVPPAVSCR